MKKPWLSIMAVTLMAQSTFDLALASEGPGARTCERHLSAAAKAEGVPIGLLHAIGVTESGWAGELNPYALNIEGKSVHAQSLQEAMLAVDNARRDGKVLIDVGCMQLNLHYHRSQFRQLRHMFDPRQNVSYAAKFLADLRKTQGSWTAAVGRYHAGPKNSAAQNRYICRVLGNIVQLKFGSWTTDAKSFCGQQQ
jgi:soluble lytic murein transglycosylase-like protein